MNKAVFLDRDGVINMERGNYITKVDDFHIHPHALKHIKKLHLVGFKIVVITNQGGIAKGLYTHHDLALMHQKMVDEVREKGGHIDQIYYCPHHPDFTNCLCRKPEGLLVEKALAKLRIHPGASVFIGDRQRDIDAAISAGVKGVLINENEDWGFVVDEMLHKFPV